MPATVPTLGATKLKTIKIRIDEDSLKIWQQHAAEDEVSLSEYVRSCVDHSENETYRPDPETRAAVREAFLEHANETIKIIPPVRFTPQNPPPDLTSAIVNTASIREAELRAEIDAELEEPPRKRKKSCPHGTEKGYNCWKCGGMAKVSE